MRAFQRDYLKCNHRTAVIEKFHICVMWKSILYFQCSQAHTAITTAWNIFRSAMIATTLNHSYSTYFSCTCWICIVDAWVVCQVYNFSDIYCYYPYIYILVDGISKRRGIRNRNHHFAIMHIEIISMISRMVFSSVLKLIFGIPNVCPSDTIEKERHKMVAKIEQCFRMKSVEFAFHTIYLLAIRFFFSLYSPL